MDNGSSGVTGSALTSAGLSPLNDMSRLQAALRYVALGLPVFPVAPVDVMTGLCQCRDGGACEQVGKHPLVKWAERATTDPSQVRRWWGTWKPAANIGIPTGQRSGLVVVDVDRQHGGPATRRAVEAAGHVFPPTLAARTRGGGWHLVYRAPAGRRVPNTTSAIAGIGATPGIDVRGDGGYIIAAPSIRPVDPDPVTGATRVGRYAWTGGHALADIPSWIVPAAAARRPPAGAGQPAAGIATQGGGRAERRAGAALAAEVRRVATSAESARNTSLFQAAANLFEIVNTGFLDVQEVRAALSEAARSVGLGEREITQTLDGQWRRKQGVRRPGWEAPAVCPSAAAGGGQRRPGGSAARSRSRGGFGR